MELVIAIIGVSVWWFSMGYLFGKMIGYKRCRKDLSYIYEESWARAIDILLQMDKETLEECKDELRTKL